MYVVWVPMNRAVERDIAGATKEVTDERARHYWDAGKQLVDGYQQILGMSEPAWDTYVLYAPGVKWESEKPPSPTYWMHQLGSARRPRVKGLFWNPVAFRQEVLSQRRP